jgi:hypothetical protein
MEEGSNQSVIHAVAEAGDDKSGWWLWFCGCGCGGGWEAFLAFSIKIMILVNYSHFIAMTFY